MTPTAAPFTSVGLKASFKTALSNRPGSSRSRSRSNSVRRSWSPMYWWNFFMLVFTGGETAQPRPAPVSFVERDSRAELRFGTPAPGLLCQNLHQEPFRIFAGARFPARIEGGVAVVHLAGK